MSFANMLLILIALSLLVSGCGARTQSGASLDEVLQAVWYVEDIAHGLPRSHTELMVVDASPAMMEIARWARGSTRDGVQALQPDPLQQRRQRWPLLAQGMEAGYVLINEGGQLRLQPPLLEVADDPLLLLLRPALRAENFDRVKTINVIFGLAEIDGNLLKKRRAVEAFQAARQQHAADVGGQLWIEPLPSSSPEEPIPSASSPEFSPRREP